jgi:hypothetical protein
MQGFDQGLEVGSLETLNNMAHQFFRIHPPVIEGRAVDGYWPKAQSRQLAPPALPFLIERSATWA